MTPPLENATLDGLQQIVDRLAAGLGRSVAVDDAQGRLVVASGHFGEEDPMRVWAVVHRYSDPRVLAHFRHHGIHSWTGPGRIPQNPDLQLKARVCCPIRDHDILFGHLFLIDDGGIPPAQVEQAVAAAARIGSLMYRRLALHEQAGHREEILVRRLVSPDPATRQQAAHEAVDGLLVHSAQPSAVVVVKVLGPVVDPDALQNDLRAVAEAVTRDRLRGVSLAWVRLDEVVLLLFDRATPEADRVAAQAVQRLQGCGHRALAGVGSETAGDSAADSFADAALAVQAGLVLPDLGPVVVADALGAYRLLLKLPPDELTAARCPPPLRRLLDAGSADSLVDTLETYLDHAGDAATTAAALHIHRSTLYYRLGRIATIGQVDLRDGSQRLTLHLALRHHRLVEAMTRRPEGTEGFRHPSQADPPRS